MQEHNCRSCRYHEKVQQAQRHATELELASLDGTHRQVAYAYLLREQQLEFFLRHLDLAQRADPYDSRWEQMRQHLFAVINNLTDAPW